MRPQIRGQARASRALTSDHVDHIRVVWNQNQLQEMSAVYLFVADGQTGGGYLWQTDLINLLS